VISYLVVAASGRDSIYTIKLRRLGGLGPAKVSPSILDLVVVADAMAQDFATTAPTTPVAELASRFHKESSRSFAVLDDDGKLVGIVTEDDVAAHLMRGNGAGTTAGDIMTQAVLTCTPDQRLRDVLRLLHRHDVGQVPVVDAQDPSKLLGVLRRREIFWAYGELAAEQERLLRETENRSLIDEDALVNVKFTISSDHVQLVSSKVRDLVLPRQCLIVSLRRARRTMVPSGATILEPGDELTFVTTRVEEQRLRQWMRACQEPQGDTVVSRKPGRARD
jgi:CBS domain-containing protein